MSLNPRLQRLFERTHASYALIPHREVFTAKEVAQVSHVAGRSLAKVVIARDTVDADLMVVLPAGQQFDQGELHRVTGRTGFVLENEAELARIFPDCEVGAMPPFGPLYGLAMYIDPCLLENGILYFQAGNHHELVRMRSEEYQRIARPFFASGCMHRVPQMTAD